MGAARLASARRLGLNLDLGGAALAVDRDVPVVAGQHAVARR